MLKNCPFCGSFLVEKYGRVRGVQRYRCQECGRTFQRKRDGKEKENKNLWNEYVFKSQILEDLSEIHSLSERQIQRRLKTVEMEEREWKQASDENRDVVLVIDTTFFDSFGLMVFRDPNRKKNLLWKFVLKETIEEYLEGIAHLERLGYRIHGIVSDGKTGLKERLSLMEYPSQLCQFHQMKTVTKYLTRRPETQAGQKLRMIMLSLPRTTKEAFTRALDFWFIQHESFLTEKTIHPESKRWSYTHGRLRSAYLSMRRNLPHLFVYELYPSLQIPNTTNSLDGNFSHLKQRINIHRGVSKETKQKMAEAILRGKPSP